MENVYLAYLKSAADFILQTPELFFASMVILGFFSFIALLYILRSFFHLLGKESKAFHKTILLIRVPKERKNEGQQNMNQEENITQIRERIAIADTIFSAISGLKREKGLVKWFTGRRDNFSFEIVVKDSKISFYVAVPDKYREFLEQQIHAQYPHAEINEEPDYNIFQPECHIVGAYLWFKYRSAFPFKTYKKMDSDPLVSLLNPLSKILDTEGAVIQYIVRPASPKWRRQGVQMIRDIKEGQKFEYVARRGAFVRGLVKWKKVMFPKKNDPNRQDSLSQQYHLTQMEEEMVKGMEEKISHGGLELTVRLISSGPSKEKAQMNLENMLNAFSQ